MIDLLGQRHVGAFIKRCIGKKKISELNINRASRMHHIKE